MKEEIMRLYWPNGNIQIEFIHLNEKRCGLGKVWNSGGQLCLEVTCKNNLEHGLTIEFNYY